jgi:hypothetical protein
MMYKGHGVNLKKKDILLIVISGLIVIIFTIVFIVSIITKYF